MFPLLAGKNKVDFLPFPATAGEDSSISHLFSPYILHIYISISPYMYIYMIYFFSRKSVKHAFLMGSSMKSENDQQNTENTVCIWFMYKRLIRFRVRQPFDSILAVPVLPLKLLKEVNCSEKKTQITPMSTTHKYTGLHNIYALDLSYT